MITTEGVKAGGATMARRRGAKKKKGTKGALIKGMSGRLPVKILNNVAFTRGLQEIMRGYAGIYALYRKNRLYYVGLTTKSLLGRIKHHRHDKHAGKWDHFIIFRIQKVRYLKDIETLIHHLSDPQGNKVKGKVPRDANLNRILQKILSEHEHDTRDIKKALKRK